MTTSEIAHRLVALCREGKYAEAHAELYADHAKSIEPDSTPSAVQEGRAALAAKTKMWHDTMEVHGGSVSEPIIAGNFFSCASSADVTHKESGNRFTMEEICIYEVANGKIVAERFFYTNPMA